MVSKFAVVALASIAAVSAQSCTTPVQLPGNAVTAPNLQNYPTIGLPFTIAYQDAGLSDITILLQYGCPENCVTVQTIVTGAVSTGGFTFTPDCTLTPDMTTFSYGIQLIDEKQCAYQYSVNFGIAPAPPGTCGAAVTSTIASVASTTTAAKTSKASTVAPSSTTTTVKSSVTPTSVASTTPASTKTTKSSSTAVPTLKTTATTHASASASASGSLTNAAATNAVGFGGAVAVFGAVLMF